MDAKGYMLVGGPMDGNQVVFEGRQYRVQEPVNLGPIADEPIADAKMEVHTTTYTIRRFFDSIGKEIGEVAAPDVMPDQEVFAKLVMGYHTT